ncbi:hypothetical protein LIA77_00259 [Sarocladium implicatum]|nr:hypothetical protein LIA77_00259 [Sarocladium implicatum]
MVILYRLDSCELHPTPSARWTNFASMTTEGAQGNAPGTSTDQHRYRLYFRWMLFRSSTVQSLSTVTFLRGTTSAHHDGRLMQCDGRGRHKTYGNFLNLVLASIGCVESLLGLQHHFEPMLSSSESSLVEDQRARVAAGPRIMVADVKGAYQKYACDTQPEWSARLSPGIEIVRVLSGHHTQSERVKNTTSTVWHNVSTPRFRRKLQDDPAQPQRAGDRWSDNPHAPIPPRH